MSKIKHPTQHPTPLCSPDRVAEVPKSWWGRRYWSKWQSHLASLALAEREKAGIKVRQPLGKLSIKNKVLSIKDKDLLGILADEVNVKEIVIDGRLKTEVELDTEITPELREEGTMRDLARMIQGLRGDANYQPKDSIIVSLELPADLMAIVDKRSAQLKKDVHAKSIEFKKAQKFDAELSSKIEVGLSCRSEGLALTSTNKTN